MARPEGLRIRYADEIALLRKRVDRMWVLVLALGYVATPLVLDDQWLSVLTFTAIAAIGAIGLNLLTGFAGQVRVGLPSGLDWSPDGQSIAVSGAGGSVYVVHP